MRFFLLSLLFPLFTSAQKNTGGYAYFQPSFFINKKLGNQFALNGGVGFTPSKYIGFGASIEAYLFKDNFKFAVPHFDIRPFIVGLDKPVSYYISLQPGYVIYNNRMRVGNTNITTKGDFAIDIVAGLMGRPKEKKGIGITMNTGYSLLSFKTANTITRYHGYKIQAGIAL